MAVQPLQPVELDLLGFGVGREAAEGLEQAMAGVMLIPGAALLLQPLKQPLLFLEMPLRVWFAWRMSTYVLGQNDFELVDFIDEVLRLSIVSCRDKKAAVAPWGPYIRGINGNKSWMPSFCCVCRWL